MKEYFHIDEQSEWKCEMFGLGESGIVYRPKKGNVPNWFWRWMQYLILGNKWIKVSNGSGKPSGLKAQLYMETKNASDAP